MKITYFLIALIFCINVTAQTEKVKIKKITQASYSVKRTSKMSRDSVFSGKYLETYEIYDENEKIIENGQYDGTGNIYEITKITKNKDGKPLKGLTTDTNGDIKKYYTTVLNESGEVQEFKNYNSNNELVYVQKNKHDENGNVLLISSQNPNSDKIYKIEFEYNSKNELIKKMKYNSDGSLKDTRTYKYDKNGNEIKQELLKSNGNYTKFISEYDENNNLTVQNWYDKDGKKKHQTSFEYVYDKYNNWITKRRFSNGELGYIWERKIEYSK